MTYSEGFNISELQQMVLVIDPHIVFETDIGMQMLFSFDVIVQAVPAVRKPREDRPAGVNPRKRNKIINNTYKSGENLKGDDYAFDRELKVDSGYATTNLGHIYDVENNMVSRKVQEEIVVLLAINQELAEMLSDAKPKKFNKEKINRMFKIIYEHFERKPSAKQFSNLVYIFDNVSNLSGLKYASLYDLLDNEYKQLILLELDKTHGILKNNGMSNRLF